MARTHWTEHYRIDPDGRKWDIYRRLGGFHNSGRGPFVSGGYTRLCDAMEAAEKAERERTMRVASLHGAVAADEDEMEQSDTCPTCGGERIRRQFQVCPNDEFHCAEGK